MENLSRSRLAPVERQPLHDAVVERLRGLITEGELAPGRKLNERELCDSLGVSRTPLREALKVLAMEGLIELNPHRGARVTLMSEQAIAEAFELLSGLEALAGELAAERITAEELERIKAAHQAMLVCKRQRDLPGYFQHNRAIHELISLAARNDMLRQTYLGLNRRLQALRYLSNQLAPKWEQAVRDHEAMIVALEARDSPGLASILRRHLLAKRDAVLVLLRDNRDAASTVGVQPGVAKKDTP